MQMENDRSDAHLSQQLSHLLHRHHCPSMDDLIDYDAGFLTTARATEITQHVAHCPHCATELARFEPETEDAPLIVQIWRRINQEAELLLGVLQRPALAFREGKEGRGAELLVNQWIEVAEEGWLFNVSQVLETGARYRFEGRILGVDSADLATFTPILASVDGDQQYIGHIDIPSSSFTITAIPQGDYYFYLASEQKGIAVETPIHFP